MSSRVWQAAATTAALAAVPLAYWQYQRYSKLNERREATKLLRKVELVATEVSVRLMHLENQVKELVEYEAGEAEEEDPADNSTLNSYYHFDSQGNKLKTKWDSYDVDAELERLEKEERGEERGEEAAVAASAAKKPVRKAPQMTRSKALATSQGIEHEFEAVLSMGRSSSPRRRYRIPSLDAVAAEAAPHTETQDVGAVVAISGALHRVLVPASRASKIVDGSSDFKSRGGRGGGRYSRSEQTDDFFEERKRQRGSIDYSIWAGIPSPPPMKKKVKKEKKREPTPFPSRSRSRSFSRSPSRSRSRSRSEVSSSDIFASLSQEKELEKEQKHKKESTSRSKRRRHTYSASESDDSRSGSESDVSVASERKKERKISVDSRDNMSELDEHEMREATKFKEAVQGSRKEEDDEEDIGPKPL
ncbi:hypothetical protein GQ600_14364 [Phytophthora cactorum]|nr:hypothetical protein GQ600_14364 [Phytophthora cactorum]